MRASKVAAAAAVIAFALISAVPVQAADRTVPSPAEAHQASLFDRVADLAQSWFGLVQPVPAVPAPHTLLAAHGADDDGPDKSAEDSIREAVSNNVILEDGAPF